MIQKTPSKWIIIIRFDILFNIDQRSYVSLIVNTNDKYGANKCKISKSLSGLFIKRLDDKEWSKSFWKIAVAEDEPPNDYSGKNLGSSIVGSSRNMRCSRNSTRNWKPKGSLLEQHLFYFTGFKVNSLSTKFTLTQFKFCLKSLFFIF